MTSAVINESKYKMLISQHPPRVIETEAEYDHSLALVHELMAKSNCTAEEAELLKDTQKDLWPIADKAIISKVLSGERAISKSLAKRLADLRV